MKLLVIEDDAALGAALRDGLVGAGFAVDVARTLREAGQLRRIGRYDLAILDLGMPDGDGMDFLAALRAEPSAKPVLVLTARGTVTDRIAGLNAGADDYLPKPFNPRELLARLRAVLRRRSPPGGRSAPLRFGRLEIDRDARVVRVDGAERALTGYQFDLLAALADSAGRVLGREALMEKAGRDTGEAFDRSIDVHVSRIRAAIEDDPRRPRRLLTVRGAGYVFAKKQDED